MGSVGGGGGLIQGDAGGKPSKGKTMEFVGLAAFRWGKFVFAPFVF